LAEGVRGEELLAEIRTEIVKAARLERLEGRGGGSPDPQ
jgi:hypothetical protein